ncbi:hypothetical protein SWSSV_gp051 [White spot syndrome virus]|uniref:Wsv150 n=1 Tax=White spot syndrome virus TaxID=342409 RepID=A0A0S2E6V3_9VIRU|nr:hypothetical protein SWSSV_gp051 [White spot syndrome virus]ALN66494.1 hypothetical protein [White spot syndrome virus]
MWCSTHLSYSEFFTPLQSQKLFRNFFRALEFRGWTASSTECQVPRVDLWVGPMSDYTRNCWFQKRTLTFVCFWNRRFWRLVDPEMRGYNLLFSLENFTLPLSQKLFKNFFRALQFRGWTASSTECQVRRVDLWVGPMSDYTRNVIAPETYINFCVFLEQAFLETGRPRNERVYPSVFTREFYSSSISKTFQKFFRVAPV